MSPAASTGPEITLTCRLAAAPDRVFAAWLDPATIRRWMFGAALGRKEEVLHLMTDPRIGGAFSFLVRRGTEEIDHVGTYLELERPHRLVFTWGPAEADTSRVTVEIAPEGKGSLLTLTHALHPDWAPYAGRTREGWTRMLGLLATVLKQPDATQRRV